MHEDKNNPEKTGTVTIRNMGNTTICPPVPHTSRDSKRQEIL